MFDPCHPFLTGQFISALPSVILCSFGVEDDCVFLLSESLLKFFLSGPSLNCSANALTSQCGRNLVGILDVETDDCI
jgi:hypothetical protein